jgi:hypothetical protein
MSGALSFVVSIDAPCRHACGDSICVCVCVCVSVCVCLCVSVVLMCCPDAFFAPGPADAAAAGSPTSGSPQPDGAVAASAAEVESQALEAQFQSQFGGAGAAPMTKEEKLAKLEQMKIEYRRMKAETEKKNEQARVLANIEATKKNVDMKRAMEEREMKMVCGRRVRVWTGTHLVLCRIISWPWCGFEW